MEIIKLSGVTYDGRQNVISNLQNHQQLLLVPQPNNLYDKYAVEVYTLDYKSVGFIPRGQNIEYFKNITENNHKYLVEVYSIVGGGCDYNYGINVTIKSAENSEPGNLSNEE